MANYTLEVKNSSNQSSRAFYGASSKPSGITIHHWNDPSNPGTHDGTVAWLRGKAGGTSNRGSSAHYVVSGKRVTQLVPENRAAWHAGNRRGNGTTIGIEMHPRMSAQDWQTLVELCADIERRHGSMKYYRHSDWKATACPGAYSNQIGKLVNDVNALLAGNKTPVKKVSKPKPTKSQKKKTVATMATEVIAGQHGTGHNARQKSLGVSNKVYSRVRAEVNRRSGVSVPKASSKTIQQMVNEVIAGKHGSGHANRRKSLGISAADYAKVRSGVNARAGVSTPQPKGKSDNQLATEVLQGKHGNGHANRRKSLGVSAAQYARIRKIVNQRS